MTACQSCKTENLDGSQYCDECGAPIGDAALLMKKSFDTSGTGEPTDESEKDSSNSRRNGQGGASHVKESQLRYKGVGQALATETVHAKLVIERGRSAGKHFHLCEEESQIGRWDADGGIFPDVDLDADDPEAKVSRRHARIILRGGQYFIEDLGSTNGTFINRGRRLLPGDRQALRDGDEIIVGKTFLRFHVAK